MDDLEARVKALEVELQMAKRVSRNNRALIWILPVLLPILLIEGSIDLKWVRLKTRQVPMEIASLITIAGLGAIGAIGKDELLKFIPQKETR